LKKKKKKSKTSKKGKKAKKSKKAKKGKKGKKSLGKHGKNKFAFAYKKSRQIKPSKIETEKIYRTKKSLELEAEDRKIIARAHKDPDFHKHIARRIVSDKKREAAEKKAKADAEYQRRLDIIVGDNSFAQKKTNKPETTPQNKPEAIEAKSEAKKTEK